MSHRLTRRRLLKAAGLSLAALPVLDMLPAAARTASPLLGAYCGNDPAAILQFEGWLGRKVDGILGYTGAASWADYDGSIPWAMGLWGGIDRRVLWSVPLIPKGATLEEAAKGTYNSHYQQAAEHLKTFRPQERRLYLRTAWEFNGYWFPWSAQKKPQAFVGAFRQFVSAFRAASKRFVIEWNVNIGDTGMNPEDAYPGDEFVDIIGMDFYWDTKWDPKDPKEAWEHARTRTYGLEWHQAFARKHGKPTAYSEWGIKEDDATPYLRAVKQWFDSHSVVYQSYWNSNAAYPGELSKGQYPAAAATYRALFGKKG